MLMYSDGHDHFPAVVSANTFFLYRIRQVICNFHFRRTLRAGGRSVFHLGHLLGHFLLRLAQLLAHFVERHNAAGFAFKINFVDFLLVKIDDLPGIFGAGDFTIALNGNGFRDDLLGGLSAEHASHLA